MTIDLSQYIGRHDENLVELVQSKLAANSSTVLDPRLITKEASYQVSTEEVITLLDELLTGEVIFSKDVQVCASEPCIATGGSTPLTDAELEASRCYVCDQDFVDAGEPLVQRHYLTRSPTSRDIRWMIVVHGFNTRGPWQEELSWSISNKLAYAAPVLIYKYGFERLGIFFRFRHKKLVKRLGSEISAAIENSNSSGRTEPPDVIVHSFGSLLFSKLLLSEDFLNLKFGRVICVGSVISPQFNWTKQISGGRVEAVLCHSGGKDLPVRIAQFAIPDSGPAGYLGFNSPSVKNVHNELFSHSSALEPKNIRTQLKRGGLWDRFLTSPLGTFSDEAEKKSPEWRPVWGMIRGLSRTLILAFITGLFVLTWAISSNVYMYLKSSFGL
ncbi:hypothetical protein [Tritonibacter mobilis]|uniref:hypothetical protein n=1 Tax=Tritonibacter mobilis TaxID=379347 RepID=UPI003A5BC7C0